jgi:hypothetical protein
MVAVGRSRQPGEAVAMNRTPFVGRHEAQRALSTDGRFGSNLTQTPAMCSSTFKANGYRFANAKDPDKNSVSISSRAFRVA